MLRRLAKTLARTVISGMPFKKRLVFMAASMPCSLKNRFFKYPLALRTFSALLFRFRTRPPFPVRTNLGISDATDVELPSTLARPLDLFGTPSLYRGERGPLLLAQQLCRHCHTFVDIGAHIGYYTHFIQAHATHPLVVYYFEPDPELYRIIQENLARTRGRHAYGFNQAIGATGGPAPFFRDLNNSSMSSLMREDAGHPVRSIAVEVVTFDAFAERAGLRDDYLVKVDVENAEWAFVEGARTALGSMPYLILEILGPARHRGLVDHLIRTFGFRCYYINGLTLEAMEAEDRRYTSGEWNFLFCRDSPDQLREKIGRSRLQVA
ncbi:MAG: FkbM family methyltransferase [Candidatus Rokuibacteriota bacterium]